jgi:general secretion pathway protein K
VTPRGFAGPGRDRGIALIVVLLVLALLLTVVADFAQTVRLEAVTTINFRTGLGETWLAEAGYQRAVAEILPEAISHELDGEGRLVFRRERLGTPAVPERLDVPLGAARFSYRITDETARINLNRAAPSLLDRLLTELRVEKTERDAIGDAIQDWRDPNEEHRLNGAESDYYQSLAVPYRSKNGDFDAVEELLQIRGVTPELLRGTAERPGLAASLTVAGTGTVNVNTADRPVLRALGLAEAEVELLVARRPYVDLSSLPPNLRRGSQRTRSDAFRIEAWAGGPEPAGRVLVAVVVRASDRGGQVQVTPVSWRWSEMRRTPRTTAAAERPEGAATR